MTDPDSLTKFGDSLIVAGNTAQFPIKGLRADLYFSADSAREFAARLLQAAVTMDGLTYGQWLSREQPFR